MKGNRHAGRSLSGGVSLNLLSRDEVEEIHLATLEVLEKTGVFVENPGALDLLDGGGATIDAARKIAKIPPHLVEDALRSCPSKIVLAGRNPENDVVLDGRRVNFVNFGGAIRVIDPYTGRVRSSTKADVAASALMVDSLSDLDIYKRAVNALDVPQGTLKLHNAEAILCNTTKHAVMDAGSATHAEKIVDMAAAAVGGRDRLRARPIITLSTCPTSPLKLINETCEVIMTSARLGVATSVTSMALAGATAPVHLAGTLVVHNAELLTAIVLSQLTQKGAAILYGSVTTSMDMRFGTAPIGSPEMAMISAGLAQLARYYRVPSSVAGGSSDSKIPDGQAAHEKTLTALFPILAGADIVSGAGMLDMGLCVSFSQMVMDCEYIQMMKHAFQGIPVNQETLAVDVIREVGPFGDFFGHESTLRHMRTVQSQPRLIDRRAREDWDQLGGTDITHRAEEEARRILGTHTPDPLPEEARATIRSIVEEAEER